MKPASATRKKARRRRREERRLNRYYRTPSRAAERVKQILLTILLIASPLFFAYALFIYK